MSVINQMLKDLDARGRGSEARAAAQALGGQRAASVPGSRARLPVWGIALMLFAVAALGAAMAAWWLRPAADTPMPAAMPTAVAPTPAHAPQPEVSAITDTP
ncbi:MAG TPA: hypothetical protein DCM32_09425, partial [Xanthomonadaceae bacterium]|nr:hypothetical protein [Xanthomonadaceae bacterium]